MSRPDPIDWTAEDERRAIFREGLLAVGEHPMTQSDPDRLGLWDVIRAMDAWANGDHGDTATRTVRSWIAILAALPTTPTPSLRDNVWTPPRFTVERLAEILHDLDGTQHYITHETSYDGDDMESSDCIGGVAAHMDDARELLVSLEGEMEPHDPE